MSYIGYGITSQRQGLIVLDNVTILYSDGAYLVFKFNDGSVERIPQTSAEDAKESAIKIKKRFKEKQDLETKLVRLQIKKLEKELGEFEEEDEILEALPVE